MAGFFRYVFKVSYNDNGNNLPESNQENQPADTKPNRQYGIGITGFDRITNPYYNPKLKALWMIIFVIFIVASIYQLTNCAKEFMYGKPTIAVDINERDRFLFPSFLHCPLEFFGTNPATNILKDEYRRIFKRTDSSIYFSDLLDLPNMTLAQLWRHQPLTFKFSLGCSTSKHDRSCMNRDNFDPIEVNTVGGLCVKSVPIPDMSFYGPVTNISSVVINPKNPEKWNMLEFYMRAFPLVDHESDIYAELEDGLPSTLSLFAKINLEEIELVNLNLPYYPCESAEVVERCVDNCTEELLYSQVTCRLPFMKNESLPWCDTPDAFNKSFEISKQVMRQRMKCRSQCPRKCYEMLFIFTAEMIKMPHGSFKCLLMRFDKNVLSIQEREWYTFSSLMADIGGSLGFFLDISVLTIPEIIEFSIQLLKKYYRQFRSSDGFRSFKNHSFFKGFYFTRRNRLWVKRFSTKSEGNNDQPINIGIVGCDRIFNQVTSRLQKIVWFTMILLSTIVCYYQIDDTIVSYLEGEPDVKLLIERNNTLQYPTLTICPYKPYQYWDYINNIRNEYADEFNISEENTQHIKVSDLMKLEDKKILSFWNDSGVSEENLKTTEVNCRSFTGTEPTQENLTIGYKEHTTVHGKCLSIFITPAAKFRGSSTIACYQLLMPDTSSPFPYNVFYHNHEDDPRTLDSNIFIRTRMGNMGLWSIHIKKKEIISRKKKPCLDASTVAQCRSKCYDSKLEEMAPCRLPFMKTKSLQLCDSPQDFNTTIEMAFSLMKHYSHEQWCNCPTKCSEYIYGINHDDNVLGIAFPVVVIILQIPNNIIKVSLEYFQMNMSSVIANICGSLGLFLGFSALTIIEIIESIYLVTARKLKKLRK